MIRDRLLPVAWLLAACTLIGAAAGARAHAEPAEWYAATNGVSVCVALDSKPTFAGLEQVMSDIEKTTRLSDYEIGTAVAESVVHICPHHRPLLKRYVDTYRGKGSVA